jgi:hypothetical protein
VNIPERAVSGPRSLKATGSPDWCWQTVDLLKRYLYNIEQTWRQADEVVSELREVSAWNVIPSEAPYGTFDKMCRELLGMPARDVAKRIDREKIKALGPPQGGRPRKENQGATQVFTHNTTLDFIARLKRDDPGLAKRVVAGEITPNAAAREKGWRKPRIVLTSPERIAVSLRKYMPREALARLAELLSEPSEVSDRGGDATERS